jgi:phage terminase large subunit-like protein
MPQGAISEILFKDFIVSLYFLFAKDAPTAMHIAGITRYLK